MYSSIDQITDEEVYPICVYSHNNPSANLLKYVDVLPMVLFIQREQAEMYREYQSKCHIVYLQGVTDIGNIKAMMVTWAEVNDFDEVFIMDDDIDYLGVASDWERPQGVYLKALKTWMWNARQSSPRLTMSSPSLEQEWYWRTSIAYNNTPVERCMLLNVRNLKKYHINFLPTEVGGTPDQSLQYQVMKAGLYSTVFKDIEYEGLILNHEEESIDRFNAFIRKFQPNSFTAQLNKDRTKIKLKIQNDGSYSIQFRWSEWSVTARRTV